MRIPNKLVLLFGVVALVALPFQIPLEEALWRSGIAAAVFVGGLVLYARRMMGAGDVKLLAVLMVLIPVADVRSFTLLLSLCILSGVGAWVITRKLRGNAPTRWRSLQPQGRFPLGLSIGMAGLVYMLAGPEAVTSLI